MSIADTLSPTLLTWPDVDGKDHYEIIDGQRVEMPPMSADSTGIAADLARFLGNYGHRADLGKA
jgi:Uma2 family endonuclease